VRAIIAALGFRTVFWTEDSYDTTSTPADISAWFPAQPGFITLQHDISPGTTKYAIDGLAKARAAGIATKPQPVALCQGAEWYKNDDITPPRDFGGDAGENTTETRSSGKEPTGNSKNPGKTGAARKIAIAFSFAVNLLLLL
jgi:hypothetical protein